MEKKEFTIVCKASVEMVEDTCCGYISFSKDEDSKVHARRTIEAEKATIMIDLSAIGEVIGIEIIGDVRMPAVLMDEWVS